MNYTHRRGMDAHVPDMRYQQDARSDEAEPDPDDLITKFWGVYNGYAWPEDRERLENWEGDMDIILIFSGLFSATVTAFIIEGYKKLQPDSGDQTVALLQFLAQQTLNSTDHSARSQSNLPYVANYTVPGTAIRYSSFWFSSLVLTLGCALGAVLVKQWARVYRQDLRAYSTPVAQARMRLLLRYGVNKSIVEVVVNGIPAILQFAVLLFFVGLMDFLFFVNQKVFAVVITIIFLLIVAFSCFTALPCFDITSPYRTVLSGVLFYATQVIRSLLSYPIDNPEPRHLLSTARREAVRPFSWSSSCWPYLRKSAKSQIFSRDMQVLTRLWPRIQVETDRRMIVRTFGSVLRPKRHASVFSNAMLRPDWATAYNRYCAKPFDARSPDNVGTGGILPQFWRAIASSDQQRLNALVRGAQDLNSTAISICVMTGYRTLCMLSDFVLNPSHRFETGEQSDSFKAFIVAGCINSLSSARPVCSTTLAVRALLDLRTIHVPGINSVPTTIEIFQGPPTDHARLRGTVKGRYSRYNHGVTEEVLFDMVFCWKLSELLGDVSDRRMPPASLLHDLLSYVDTAYRSETSIAVRKFLKSLSRQPGANLVVQSRRASSLELRSVAIQKLRTESNMLLAHSILSILFKLLCKVQDEPLTDVLVDLIDQLIHRLAQILNGPASRDFQSVAMLIQAMQLLLEKRWFDCTIYPEGTVYHNDPVETKRQAKSVMDKYLSIVDHVLMTTNDTLNASRAKHILRHTLRRYNLVPDLIEIDGKYFLRRMETWQNTHEEELSPRGLTFEIATGSNGIADVGSHAPIPPTTAVRLVEVDEDRDGSRREPRNRLYRPAKLPRPDEIIEPVFRMQDSYAGGHADREAYHPSNYEALPHTFYPT